MTASGRSSTGGFTVQGVNVVTLSHLVSGVVGNELTVNYNLVTNLNLVLGSELDIAKIVAAEDIVLVGGGAIVRNVVASVAVAGADFLDFGKLCPLHKH